jgi:hypothetical protein
VALMSYGAHYLAKTGTCSNTGYVSYGPLPQRGGNEALYILSAFFVGPMAAIVGWLLARAWGWLSPTVCIGFGAALITIRNGTIPVGGHVGLGEVGRVAELGLYRASRHLNDPAVPVRLASRGGTRPSQGS